MWLDKNNGYNTTFYYINICFNHINFGNKLKDIFILNMSSLFDLIYSQPQSDITNSQAENQSAGLNDSSSDLFSQIYRSPSAGYNDDPRRHSNLGGFSGVDGSLEELEALKSTDRQPRRNVQFTESLSTTKTKRKLLKELEVATNSSGGEYDYPESSDVFDSDHLDSDDDRSTSHGRDSGKDRIHKFLGPFPYAPKHRLPLYHNLPELNTKSKAYYNSNLRMYTPNELAYVKFPQFEQSVLETQRKVLRETWLTCCHSRDYEGA